MYTDQIICASWLQWLVLPCECVRANTFTRARAHTNHAHPREWRRRALASGAATARARSVRLVIRAFACVGPARLAASACAPGGGL
eukprot:6193145-Pleurochrysis_carterae.AAC.1